MYFWGFKGLKLFLSIRFGGTQLSAAQSHRGGTQRWGGCQENQLETNLYKNLDAVDAGWFSATQFKTTAVV